MTGSPWKLLELGRRVDQVNTLLEGLGLPIPPLDLWDGFSRLRWAADWSVFPAIIRPAAEDGSVGVTHMCVVQDQPDLARRLLDAGVPLACQTVLLKSVNDDPAVMKRLMQRLLMARVRPYYIHQEDVVAGGSTSEPASKRGWRLFRP